MYMVKYTSTNYEIEANMLQNINKSKLVTLLSKSYALELDIILNLLIEFHQ